MSTIEIRRTSTLSLFCIILAIAFVACPACQDGSKSSTRKQWRVVGWENKSGRPTIAVWRFNALRRDMPKDGLSPWTPILLAWDHRYRLHGYKLDISENP